VTTTQEALELHMRILHGFADWTDQDVTDHYGGKSWEQVHDQDHAEPVENGITHSHAPDLTVTDNHEPDGGAA
jgi:hypothetical protein